mgnify:FL=1
MAFSPAATTKKPSQATRSKEQKRTDQLEKELAAAKSKILHLEDGTKNHKAKLLIRLILLSIEIRHLLKKNEEQQHCLVLERAVAEEEVSRLKSEIAIQKKAALDTSVPTLHLQSAQEPVYNYRDLVVGFSVSRLLDELEAEHCQDATCADKKISSGQVKDLKRGFSVQQLLENF